MHHFLAVLGVVVVGLSSCNLLTKPPYPKPPAYPNAQNIQTWEKEEGQARFTAFQTEDTPGAVLTFFKDALSREGWEISKGYPDGISFRYLNGADNPAFHLDITVMLAQNGQTHVELRQVISGPFWWPAEK